MRRLLLISILSAGTMLAANPPPFAYIKAGPMLCGAIRRGEQVQVWCYTGLSYTAATALENAITSVRIGNVTTRILKYGPDTIRWTFTRGTDDVMNYSVTANGPDPQTGILP
jgi:hypothetical protein